MSRSRNEMFQAWPEGYSAIAAIHQLIGESELKPSLVELVRMRASQLNGCAYCIDMHSKDARAAGETEQRLYALSAWRETAFYTEQERAALALTEAVTTISHHEQLDRAVHAASQHFEPERLTRLLYAVIEINAWNRLAITTASPEPGTYQPSR